jgi:ABC-type Fe3+ transport system permease subunit
MATVKKAVAKKVPAQVAQHHGVDWRSLYLYAVCLITLLVVLFSTVAFINGAMNAIFPDPGYVDVYSSTKPSAQALASQESQNQRQAFKSMFTSFTTALIAAPLYVFHWRQTKKSA